MYKVALILHVLGATVWTGGHLVLALTVLPRALRGRDPSILQDFEGPFEKIGIPALLIQVVTGLWLAHRLVPPADWFSFGTPAAIHVGAKLILLILTLLLAMHARLRLIPGLSDRSLPLLAAHIIAVTVVSVLLVILGVGLRAGGVL